MYMQFVSVIPELCKTDRLCENPFDELTDVKIYMLYKIYLYA